MDQYFVMAALERAGHVCAKVQRVMDKNKPGEYAEFCFITFNSQAQAEACVREVNGQPMSHPDLQGRRKTWKLSWGSRAANQEDPSYSIFVGDISGDVTEDQLLAFFKMRYASCVGAKIQCDDQGRGKGFGFVKFAHVAEQQAALREMTDARGLGTRPIRVGQANGAKKKAPGEWQGCKAALGNLHTAQHVAASQYQQQHAAAWAAYYAQQGLPPPQ